MFISYFLGWISSWVHVTLHVISRGKNSQNIREKNRTSHRLNTSYQVQFFLIIVLSTAVGVSSLFCWQGQLTDYVTVNTTAEVYPYKMMEKIRQISRVWPHVTIVLVVISSFIFIFLKRQNGNGKQQL